MSARDRQVGGSHYRDMQIQPSDFIYRNGLNWYEANAVKYICRHRAKGGRQDLQKAIHYLELLLDAEYGNVDSTHSAVVEAGAADSDDSGADLGEN